MMTKDFALFLPAVSQLCWVPDLAQPVGSAVSMFSAMAVWKSNA